jgi:signal transduction protein with GAF and PtsI domain
MEESTEKLSRPQREEEIYRISTLVAGNFEIQEVLDRLAEAAVKVTGTTACSIRLLDTDIGKLTMRSTYGLSESSSRRLKAMRSSSTICAWTAGSFTPRPRWPKASSAS